MAETRIDVQVEHKHPRPDEQQHPNTCPRCNSHYRDDELASALYVCSQSDHLFVSAKQVGDRTRDPRLEEEGSSAIVAQTGRTVYLAGQTAQRPDGSLDAGPAKFAHPAILPGPADRTVG